jgi:hypothetical protein
MSQLSKNYCTLLWFASRIMKIRRHTNPRARGVSPLHQHHLDMPLQQTLLLTLTKQLVHCQGSAPVGVAPPTVTPALLLEHTLPLPSAAALEVPCSPALPPASLPLLPLPLPLGCAVCHSLAHRVARQPGCLQ